MEPLCAVLSLREHREAIDLGLLDAGSKEYLTHHFGAIGPVILQRLSGPQSRDQYAAASTAEVLGVMRLRGTGSGNHSLARGLRLHSKAQPVPATGGTRQPADFTVQAMEVCALPTSPFVFGGVRITEALREILRQVRNPPVGISFSGKDPLNVHLAAKSHHMRWSRIRV